MMSATKGLNSVNWDRSPPSIRIGGQAHYKAGKLVSWHLIHIHKNFGNIENEAIGNG